MDDLIKRADAIEAMCSDCEGEPYPKCDQKQYCEEVKALLALPSAESPNDVVKKPKTVRYKLHKPIEYVSIEFDEEEEITQIGHYTAYGERGKE